MIYLDNAATTQIDPAVLEKMMPFLQENYGNAGTLYKLGRRSRSAIENARAQVAKLIDAEPEQIVFTSGGTEGNNMVINFAGRYMQANGKKIMAVSAIEHDSVLKPARYLATNGVIGLETLPVDSTGHVILGNVKKLDSQNTGFISIMRANNELGIANNVQLAGKYAHEHGALFHVDCVQALGSERLSMKEIDCDFATFSSHKIHGPKGVGAVYIKDPERFIPLIFGGENQEHGLRGGTENVAGIVGFGEACRLICEIDVNELQQRYDMMCCAFYQALMNSLNDDNLSQIVGQNGSLDNGTKVLNIRVAGVDASTLVLAADTCEVCISAGSACNSKDMMPSHVLKALGLTDDEARSSFRVSFSRYNTVDDAKAAGLIIGGCIKAVRQ